MCSPQAGFLQFDGLSAAQVGQAGLTNHIQVCLTWENPRVNKRPHSFGFHVTPIQRRRIWRRLFGSSPEYVSINRNIWWQIKQGWGRGIKEEEKVKEKKKEKLLRRLGTKMNSKPFPHPWNTHISPLTWCEKHSHFFLWYLSTLLAVLCTFIHVPSSPALL